MSLALTVMALVILAFFVALALVSRRENETVATRRSLLFGLATTTVMLLVAWVPWAGFFWLGCLILFALGTGGILLMLPSRTPAGYSPVQPALRTDERSIMFSRAELEPGTPRFDQYYTEHPEHRAFDDHFRKLPGLMSPQAGKYEQLSFDAAAASFATVDKLSEMIAGTPAVKEGQLDPPQTTKFLKEWAQKLGAHSAGVTQLQDYHFYSHKGRGADYGQPLEPRSGFAVAFTLEMDHRHLGTAPEGPTLMESAQQYLNAGVIAVQLAEFIRRQGYCAEAHIDGNYKVVCPLVGRDAGLGEIGRMGLLMTPRLGPRVRLAVVTTDMPLVPDPPGHDPTVLEFCTMCQKCADVCPVQAIPQGARAAVDGIPRWQLDSEACFSYWCAAGTDCGQCMKVCPYSHPDTPVHNFVRWGLGRSYLFRRFALLMDDLLYGRRPQAFGNPDWIPSRTRRS